MRRIRETERSFGFRRKTREIVEKPSLLECLFGRGRHREKPRKREKWESGKELMARWLRD